MNINIRTCNKEDLEYVVALQKEWEEENITYGFIAADEDCLEMKPGKYFLIAESKNSIIGFIYGSIHQAKNMAIFNDNEPYIEIDDIYVTSNFRNTGVGSKLIETLLNKAKHEGIQHSLIYSSTKDIESILEFYKKHHFKSWNIQMFQ